MTFQNYTQCNAKAKSTGQRCCNPAVNGSTKCRVHGGKTPRGVESPHYRTGRYTPYAAPKLQTKITDLDAFEIFDLADELQTQRALLAEYLERFQNGVPMPEQSISSMMAWLNSIGGMVERMMKIRNETALTGAEIALLQARTVDLVTRYIDDPEKRRQFVIELFQIEQPPRLT